MTALGMLSPAGVVLTLVALRVILRARAATKRASPRHRRAARLAEVDDVFSPGRRHQIDHRSAVDTQRFTHWVGAGDPLENFPDPDALRSELDPSGVDRARRGARAGKTVTEQEREDQDDDM